MEIYQHSGHLFHFRFIESSWVTQDRVPPGAAQWLSASECPRIHRIPGFLMPSSVSEPRGEGPKLLVPVNKLYC